MKKIWVLFSCCTIIIACNSSGAPAKETDKKSQAVKTGPSPEDEKALEMIGSLDCTSCHKLEERFVGPSYKEVANKYEATDSTISHLATKVVHGGQGAWGSVPMTAHPDLSMDSAKLMIKYIMTLKDKK